MEIKKIQPSQLYLNKEKLAKISKNLSLYGIKKLMPLPVKLLNDEIIFTDGHTRAFVLWKNGVQKIEVYWESEDEDLDWELYEVCVNWCKDAQIRSIEDLGGKIIDSTSYKEKWINRCQKMHLEMEKIRNEKSFVKQS